MRGQRSRGWGSKAVVVAETVIVGVDDVIVAAAAVAEAVDVVAAVDDGPQG